MIRTPLRLTLAALLLAILGSAAPLKKIGEIQLPGPPGKRFDYLTIDAPDHLLLSAHLGAGLLYAIDLRTHRLVATVHGVPGVEGVVADSEQHKAYTSDWFESKIGVVDLRAMKVVKRLPTLDKPDGSAYAAPFHQVFVSDERGRAEAIVDTNRDQIIKTLHFNSETGMPRYDPVARKVYVNLQNTNEFAVIDPATDTVVARYPVRPCRGNHGMVLDPQHHRAFLSCEDNGVMAVFNLDTHRVIATLPMAGGPDVIKFDPGLKRIYVACFSGAISIFQQRDPNHYSKLEDFPVEHAVHSLAVDPATHILYVPEQEVHGRPAAVMAIYQAVP
jgi:DNA-binding beta-propeller fold protein YncE